jgi:hypothetical protein
MSAGNRIPFRVRDRVYWAGVFGSEPALLAAPALWFPALALLSPDTYYINTGSGWTAVGDAPVVNPLIWQRTDAIWQQTTPLWV